MENQINPNNSMICFVCYLKIINIFYKKKIIYASQSILSKELKNLIEMFGRLSGVIYQNKTDQINIGFFFFWSITQEPLDRLKF